MDFCEENEKGLSAVALAHRVVRSRVREGATAVDATAGNGRDTVFLARLVGETGRVFAVDLQAAAAAATRRRLEAGGVRHRVGLCVGGHENLRKLLPEAEGVAAVMFNLGYLPGGDRTVTTRVETTLAGLKEALSLLAPGGVLTVVCYPGHPGGDTESWRVREWADTLPRDRYSVRVFRSSEAPARAPFVVAVARGRFPAGRGG